MSDWHQVGIAQLAKAPSQFWQCDYRGFESRSDIFRLQTVLVELRYPKTFYREGGGGRVGGLGLVISNTSQKLSIGGTYFSQCKTWRIRVRWILRWKFESVVSARRVWDSNPRLETSRRFWRALIFAQIVPDILFWLCSSIVQRMEDVLGYIILEIQKKNICKTLRENYRRKSSATSQWHFAC